MVLPIAFKDGNIICFSTPRFEVDAALETILLKGLEDHTFCIDLCTENKIKDQVKLTVINSLNSFYRLKSGLNITTDQFMYK